MAISVHIPFVPDLESNGTNNALFVDIVEDLLCLYACSVIRSPFTAVPEADRNAFFTWRRWKGARMMRASWSRDMGRGRRWSRACSCCTRMHYHSFTVCHPLLFCHSLSLFLPPTFSFHPRPTFLVVVVGVAIWHGAPCEKHKAELGQILHALEQSHSAPHLSTPQVCFMLLL